MTELVECAINDWSQLSNLPQDDYYSVIESGHVLFMPKLRFVLNKNEQPFLTPGYCQLTAKNVSYHPTTGQLKGVNTHTEQLSFLLKRFALQSKTLIHALFPKYKQDLIDGRTSFRPIQIAGRKTSPRKDDTRLHVDAFPSSPNQGKRILRVFSNIHPGDCDRVWRVGEAFENVAKRYYKKIKKPIPGSASLLKRLHITKSRRSFYDHCMLQIHDQMKFDTVYQADVSQQQVKFPPGSTWIVFSDQVSHAVLSGQHILEQTFYLPVTAMQDENRSPLRVLERLKGVALI